jgi:hypothetical protein
MPTGTTPSGTRMAAPSRLLENGADSQSEARQDAFAIEDVVLMEDLRPLPRTTNDDVLRQRTGDQDQAGAGRDGAPDLVGQVVASHTAYVGAPEPNGMDIRSNGNESR